MIDVQFTGDGKLVANLKGMGEKVAEAGHLSILRSTIKVLYLAKEKAPIGNPSRGDKHPGTLRRAINHRVTRSDYQIVGTVGIKLTYAAAHEFGINKTVTVPAHLRMQTMAWGKKLREPHQVMVKSHPMKMNIPERSYLRSSLKELAGDITADLRASVGKAVHK